eukprot:gene21333-22171_t
MHLGIISGGQDHPLNSLNLLISAALLHGVHGTILRLGKDDMESFSSTAHNLLLYLHTARRVFSGDIVIALEADSEGLNEELKEILRYYRAVVYLLPNDLCSKATTSIFCGSAEERVPASVFRFYFFEMWAAMYPDNSLLLITDFRDVFFQADPFSFKTEQWLPDYQLAVFQEFHPNMVIDRCRFNRVMMSECFGDESLRSLGHQIIVSSGATMGTKDAILVWTRHMTLVRSRLVYGNKLRQLGVRIKLFSQGEGAVNSVGGLLPNTVGATGNTSDGAQTRAITISGPIKSFWKILNDDGFILNWNGEVWS